jgi:hypothetical protein
LRIAGRVIASTAPTTPTASAASTFCVRLNVRRRDRFVLLLIGGSALGLWF